MTDIGPEIRQRARKGKIRYIRHAIERIKEYKLSILQVQEMLKNCTHNPSKSDANGLRVEGIAPEQESTGTRKISAHVQLYEQILVITVING